MRRNTKLFDLEAPGTEAVVMDEPKRYQDMDEDELWDDIEKRYGAEWFPNDLREGPPLFDEFWRRIGNAQ